MTTGHCWSKKKLCKIAAQRVLVNASDTWSTQVLDCCTEKKVASCCGKRKNLVLTSFDTRQTCDLRLGLKSAQNLQLFRL